MSHAIALGQHLTVLHERERFERSPGGSKHPGFVEIIVPVKRRLTL
jgi:hypothetical protein